MFKKSVIESKQIFFDSSTKWFVDILFYYEYFKETSHLELCEEYLINITCGSATQITNSIINPKIVINEFFYICRKYQLQESNPFLFYLTLIELLAKHKIKSNNSLTQLLGSVSIENTVLIFKLVKLPINYRFYSLMKYIYIKLV